MENWKRASLSDLSNGTFQTLPYLFASVPEAFLLPPILSAQTCSSTFCFLLYARWAGALPLNQGGPDEKPNPWPPTRRLSPHHTVAIESLLFVSRSLYAVTVCHLHSCLSSPPIRHFDACCHRLSLSLSISLTSSAPKRLLMSASNQLAGCSWPPHPFLPLRQLTQSETDGKKHAASIEIWIDLEYNCSDRAVYEDPRPSAGCARQSLRLYRNVEQSALTKRSKKRPRPH